MFNVGWGLSPKPLVSNRLVATAATSCVATLVTATIAWLIATLIGVATILVLRILHVAAVATVISGSFIITKFAAKLHFFSYIMQLFYLFIRLKVEDF